MPDAMKHLGGHAQRQPTPQPTPDLFAGFKDPGTVVLPRTGIHDYAHSIGHMLIQGSDDPRERPVYSSLPLNSTRTQRLLEAAKDRRNYETARKGGIEDTKKWLSAQAKDTENLSSSPLGVPQQYEDRWSQVTQNMNTVFELEQQLRDEKMPPAQKITLENEINRFRLGANAQLNNLRNDLMRQIQQQLRVLKGKRKI